MFGGDESCVRDGAGAYKTSKTYKAKGTPSYVPSIQLGVWEEGKRV